jgi:hypothetical protein
MKDPRSEALNHVDLTVEGNEDLTVRPWGGPSPRNTDPAVQGAEDFPLETVHILIANDEDLTVRPWRRSTAQPMGGGGAAGIESQGGEEG